jgi:hypothetical protein
MKTLALALLLLASSAFAGTSQLNYPVQPQPVYVTAPAKVQVTGGMESVTITSMPPVSVAFPDSYMGVSIKAGAEGLSTSARITGVADGVSITVRGNGDAYSDNDTIESNLVAAETYGMVYNGGVNTWDRMRGNTTGVYVQVTPTSSVMVNLSGPASVSGNYTVAGQSVTVTAAGFSAAVFTMVAGFTGTLVVDISIDGSTWAQVPFYYGSAAIPTLVISQANPATGSFIFVPSVGAARVRLRASAYTSGTGTSVGVPTNANLNPTVAVGTTAITYTQGALVAGTAYVGQVKISPTAGVPLDGGGLQTLSDTSRSLGINVITSLNITSTAGYSAGCPIQIGLSCDSAIRYAISTTSTAPGYLTGSAGAYLEPNKEMRWVYNAAAGASYGVSPFLHLVGATATANVWINLSRTQN